MPEPAADDAFTPLPLPGGRAERTILFAMRRMAIHGIRDASAAWLMLDLFSARFIEPLVMLRAFMFKLSRAARHPLRIAACCAPFMTEDEALILTVLRQASREPEMAEQALARLTRNHQTAKALAAAARFARAAAEHAVRFGVSAGPPPAR